MKNDLKITSLNIGKREKIQIGNNVVETGIYKKPSPDSLRVNQHGFIDDVVVDTTSHGGIDQLFSSSGWMKKIIHLMPPNAHRWVYRRI